MTNDSDTVSNTSEVSITDFERIVGSQTIREFNQICQNELFALEGNHMEVREIRTGQVVIYKNNPIGQTLLDSSIEEHIVARIADEVGVAQVRTAAIRTRTHLRKSISPKKPTRSKEGAGYLMEV